ncbi:MAG: hypothetical protein IIC88_01350 [Chloroflexi bacterium]|nr:hypothetical protein [Chloroflexota bacterium]
MAFSSTSAARAQDGRSEHAPLSAIEAAAAEDETFVVVRQRNKFFDPPVVVIHEGDTVVWVNETGGGWHDVQSYEGEFHSGRMDPGDTFTQTFEEAGVHGYLCSPHVIDGMQGVVVVLPEGTPLPEPLPSPPAPTSSPAAIEPPLPSPPAPTSSPAAIEPPLPSPPAPTSSPVLADPVALGTPDTIATVAGSGGNGGLATDASLYLPEGVALDDGGRLYISDTENCQIRQVAPTGTIVSILGHESCGYSMGGDADLGPWLHTNHPRGVAVGPDGAVYVADTINCRVRRVEEGGAVSTVAGNGSCRAGGDGGPAVDAGIYPWGLAWDQQGNLYVADVFNCRIRRVDEGGTITTVAGTGACGFSGDGGPATQATLFFPRDVAVGTDGALYIADAANCRVRRVDASGVIDTVAGAGDCDFSGDGGPATEAGLHPWALAFDSDGGVLVADRENCRLRRFVPGGPIATVAGNGLCGFSGDGGPAAEAALHWPSDVTLAADGAIHVADTGNCRVRRIDREGNIATVAGSGVCAPGGDGGPAIAGGGWHPIGLAMGKQGEWYFSELDTCRVRRVDASGVVTTYAGNGVCGYSGDGGPATQARLSDLLGGLAVADDGTLFIAEGYNCRVRQVDTNGVIDTIVGTGTCGFSGDGGPARQASLWFVADVALDGSGGLLIADPFNCRVRRVDLASGVIATVVGDGSCRYHGEDIPAEEAGIDPWGVAVGPEGAIYLSDSGNCRVRRVGSEGRITTVAGGDECGLSGDGGPATQAQLMRPQDLTLDQEGNLYVADLRTFTVRKVDSQGIISTVAGVGISRPIDIGGFDPTNGFLCSIHNLPVPVPSYLADGGPASEAGLYFPYGIALSPDGHLYIADSFDHRVRRVTCGAGVPCSGPAIPEASASVPAASVASSGGAAPEGAVGAPSTGRTAGPDAEMRIAGLLAAIGGAALLLLGAAFLAYTRTRRRRRGSGGML